MQLKWEGREGLLGAGNFFPFHFIYLFKLNLFLLSSVYFCFIWEQYVPCPISKLTQQIMLFAVRDSAMTSQLLGERCMMQSNTITALLLLPKFY